jgi:hypothetical protein
MPESVFHLRRIGPGFLKFPGDRAHREALMERALQLAGLDETEPGSDSYREGRTGADSQVELSPRPATDVRGEDLPKSTGLVVDLTKAGLLGTNVWHLPAQSGLDLAARTDSEIPARVDAGHGLRIARKPLPNDLAHISIEVPVEVASLDHVVRVVVGRKPNPQLMLFALVSDDAGSSVLTSEMTVPVANVWPELFVGLPAVRVTDLKNNDLRAIPRSVAAASVRCKEAWRRLAAVPDVETAVRDAIRAGLR